MLARAVERYIRMSPRKVRYVAQALRGHTVADALKTLTGVSRRATGPLAKAIGSALANARQRDPTITGEAVVISRLVIDGGPAWKRYRAAPFGRATVIRKPTSHISVELERARGSAQAPMASASAAQQAVSPRAAARPPASGLRLRFRRAKAAGAGSSS